MKNVFLFLALVILASCSCDDSMITGVELRLFHTNVISISDGVRTTSDGSDPISENNPSTVIYPPSFFWELDRTVFAAESCINSINEITSILLTCDKDFTLEGETISAGTSFLGDTFFDSNDDVGSFHFILKEFSFEKGTHTFRLEIETDNKLSFNESVTVDMQI